MPYFPAQLQAQSSHLSKLGQDLGQTDEQTAETRNSGKEGDNQRGRKNRHESPEIQEFTSEE